MKIIVEVMEDDFVEAICPFCKYNNIIASEVDICTHFDKINLEGNYVHFYFSEEIL